MTEDFRFVSKRSSISQNQNASTSYKGVTHVAHAAQLAGDGTSQSYLSEVDSLFGCIVPKGEPSSENVL